MDELARGLVEEGRQVTVLTRGRKRSVRAHDRVYPAQIVRLPGHGWVRRHRRYLGLYAPFLGRHLTGRVLHAATYSVARPLLRAIAQRGARLVLYVHGLEIQAAARAPDERAELDRVLETDPLVVANSRRVAEMISALGARQVEVVAPAIDPARITPEGTDLRERWGVADRPVILTLGRLIERKGQDVVLRALPEIRRAIPGAVYVIAGRGPDRARLEALVKELHLEDAVRFAGFVDEPDLAAAYRTADVYTMIARETEEDVEGFGITYLEAAAAGRATLGGRSGGVEDAIVDGVTGRLVPPEDPGAVAAALIDLLRDPAARRALGAAGRARVLGELGRAAMARRILALSEG
ncbi:MAG: glycosyltransferase family 4 protein [Deltaproteobacteria bacterium]|nr:glycosyltransferase family 4 protein [Deltaproteobacteria bacterium]